MDNLILNSQWLSGGDGEPQYFNNTGPITYDNFCVNGNQTCSVTMIKQGGQARTQYEVPIPVCGQQRLVFGCCIRCIGADCCNLQVDFYDANNRLLDSSKENITGSLNADFNNQMGTFLIPCNTAKASLSIQFVDRVTACTYCAPFCYFC